MRKFQRVEQPEFLARHWIEWGEAWKGQRVANPSASFSWREINGTKVNLHLQPILQAQTQNHCSFCDFYPVSPPSNDTIEHFQPKTSFPELAYYWLNLYYCCDFCQGHGAVYDSNTLRPDAIDYTFERYFTREYLTGDIKPNPRATAEDQNRARVTIQIYKLNVKHPELRRLALRHRSKMPDEPLDSFPYRDFIETTPV